MNGKTPITKEEDGEIQKNSNSEDEYVTPQ